MKTTNIKFYYNGIKVNNEKTLIKCGYYLTDDNIVNIFARDYDSLPADIFAVENDTDYYTDYFDSDCAKVTPEHPLYKYVKYACELAHKKELEKYVNWHEKNMITKPYLYKADDLAYLNRKEELKTLALSKNPGQPTDNDLKAVESMNIKAESDRIAQEHATEVEAQEKYTRMRINGRHYIEETTKKYPIKDGQPVVIINWSEHPAFYAWDENTLELSITAAEKILKHLDEEAAADDSGYYKTKFSIYTDPDRANYEGRYDLGDDDGGLIAHIRGIGEWYKNNPRELEQGENAQDIINFANYLESYITEVGSLEEYKKSVKQEIAQEADAYNMTIEEYAANGFEPAAPMAQVIDIRPFLKRGAM